MLGVSDMVKYATNLAVFSWSLQSSVVPAKGGEQQMLADVCTAG